MNPYLARQAEKTSNSHGKKSEAKAAIRLGARLHPNSGAMAGAKSDASLKDFRLEMKSTTSHRLTIERGWLEKITSEALRQGQKPALSLSFVDDSGDLQSSAWVAIPEWVFKELVNG